MEGSQAWFSGLALGKVCLESLRLAPSNCPPACSLPRCPPLSGWGQGVRLATR